MPFPIDIAASLLISYRTLFPQITHLDAHPLQEALCHSAIARYPADREVAHEPSDVSAVKAESELSIWLVLVRADLPSALVMAIVTCLR